MIVARAFFENQRARANNNWVVTDKKARPLTSLRLSVTDRCNLRCSYCMPEADYTWLPREDILTFEEIERLLDIFLDLGVTRVRLTGGEPLLRQDLPELVRRIAKRPQVEDLALTTNGVLLARHAGALHGAGLHRITVSLDTLHHDRFERLARFDSLDETLEGIETAARLFRGLKIDTVVMRDVNDDELIDLIEFGQPLEAEVRFIEYMDVGGATQWSQDQVVSKREILERLEQHYGPSTPIAGAPSAPASRYRLPNGSTFGIIASTTEPFCQHCDRSRLTADGLWFLCLYAQTGTDFRQALRSGASDDEIASQISDTWTQRTDAGAEDRSAETNRSQLIPADTLRRNPHLEMHTRGG